MSPLLKAAIADMREVLKSYDFKLIFSKAKILRYKDIGAASGVFDDEKKLIKIAKGNPDWIWTLFHEYAHFIQFIHKTDANNEYEKFDKIFDIWKYTTGHKYSKRIAIAGIRAAIRYELEAEKLAVTCLKDFYSETQIASYIKTANSILFRYAAILRNHKWHDYKRLGEVTLSKFDSKLPRNEEYYFKNLDMYENLLEN